MYRLLANNLFTRGLKYAFDFVAVFSILGLSYVSKQAAMEKIIDFNFDFDFDFDFHFDFDFNIDLNFDFSNFFPDFGILHLQFPSAHVDGIVNSICCCGKCANVSIGNFECEKYDCGCGLPACDICDICDTCVQCGEASCNFVYICFEICCWPLVKCCELVHECI